MSDPVRPDQPDTFRSRRTVLRTAGIVALAGGGAALAACSADSQTPTAASPAAPASSAPASSAPASSAPASSAPASSAPASSSAPAVPKGPSVATSEVPVGGGVILKDADYVITQPTKGKYKAFSKICTHQGCPVTEVAGGTINCKCHGSAFSIEDGSVQKPPANKPLAETPVVVAGGKVVVDA